MNKTTKTNTAKKAQGRASDVRLSRAEHRKREAFRAKLKLAVDSTKVRDDSTSVTATADVIENAAYHEAGHAVMAILGRLPIVRISIPKVGDVIDNASHAFVEQKSVALPRRERGMVRWAVRHITMLLGGVYAELHRRDTVTLGFASDLLEARELRDAALRYFPETFPAGEELRGQVQRDIADHWCEVEAIAQALMTKGSLSGRKVRAVARAASSDAARSRQKRRRTR